MTTTQANKIIRDYVKQYGRRLLREKLHALAKDFPGYEQMILDAGNIFLENPNANK